VRPVGCGVAVVQVCFLPLPVQVTDGETFCADGAVVEACCGAGHCASSREIGSGMLRLWTGEIDY
jgi:hypothetical protein